MGTKNDFQGKWVVFHNLLQMSKCMQTDHNFTELLCINQITKNAKLNTCSFNADTYLTRGLFLQQL